MEASEKGLIPEKVKWGNFEAAQKLVAEIGKGEGLGKLVCQGVKAASESLGKGSQRWAMHVKGLEISAYNCHGCPGMALSFGTSPIGAHHKDAWIISWEIANDRFSYNKSKVEKLIEFQRIRGGFFESATVCRLPWVEEAQSQGKVKGIKVDREKYEQMLSYYYELRGWDENGIPLKETLDRLGLKEVSKEMMG